VRIVVAALVAVSPAVATAGDQTPAAPVPDPVPADPVPAPVPVPVPVPDPDPDEAAGEDDRGGGETLDSAVARHERELRRLEHAQSSAHDRLDSIAPISRFITAYIDAGFFVPAGDGAGVRSDLGHLHFPEYQGIVPAQWVFMGDPLSTAINTRGEPADTGDSRAVTDDPIDSRGNPAFIANALGLRLLRQVSERVRLDAHVELMPRGRDVRFSVETATVQLQPMLDHDFVVLAGKLDSVIGAEYRNQDATDRVTITPSLLCRYTCGRPVGVQARYSRSRVSGSVAVTSGDMFQPGFEEDDRLVASTLPTVSARIYSRIALAGTGTVTAGVSGAVGPQDRQANDGITQWHYGLDLALYDFHDVDVVVEWMQGRVPGKSAMSDRAECAVTECLRYRGGYALVAYHARRWLQPYARTDWRDALHQHGREFVYISKTARFTAGFRLQMDRRVVAKVEYTLNRELGEIPQFANDVLTTSVVVSTD
jgi:hypothetical protein